MSEEFEPGRKKKLKLAHISTVISITLVLFMAGLLAGIVVFAEELSNYVKEKFTVEIFLEDGINEQTLADIKTSLETFPGVKSVTYTDKEQARQIYMELFNDDFSDILDENPLYASYTVIFEAESATSTVAQNLENTVKEEYGNDIVEVFKKKELMEEANNNLEKIGVVISVVSVLLLFIVIALINNTIRLAIYSQRFTIKTMQLVGATPGFIRRPFVIGSVLRGLLSGLIASVLLALLGLRIYERFPEFVERLGIWKPAGIIIFVIALGVFISGFSTRLAVNRFLRKNTGDLY
ncbi:MAG: permease-like cell division protein FtsX [Flavobacteriales bacterium]|nr:permease-like cell division protein FtsX [Flavobacteriales bacterium]